MVFKYPPDEYKFCRGYVDYKIGKHLFLSTGILRLQNPGDVFLLPRQSSGLAFNRKKTTQITFVFKK